MRRFLIFFVVFLFTSGVGFSFEPKALERALEDFSQGIAQTAYSMQERANSAERLMYETAVAKTERAEQSLKKIIGQIDSAKSMSKAKSQVKAFGKKDKVSKHASTVVMKMLNDRATFLQVSDVPGVPGEEEVQLPKADSTAGMAATPQILLSLAQRRLIMVQVPIAEATIHVIDNNKTRRVEALKEMLSRHQCKIESSAVSEEGEDPQHNLYVSGKKFVLEALIRHFNGTTVANDLKAIVEVSAGGFWNGTTTEIFNLNPPKDEAEKGSLSWYMAVLEKDPLKYLAEKDYNKLAKLGKIETLGGAKKLRLKNTTVNTWIMSSKGAKRDAVYFNKASLGDVFVDIP